MAELSFTGEGRTGWGTLAFLASGYALCRACSELPLGLGGFAEEWEELGKAAGLVAVIVSLLLRTTAAARLVEPAANLALVVGCALAVTCPLSASPQVGYAAGLFVGAGSAACMMLWLEAFGLLPARRIVVCLALAYVMEAPVSLLAHSLSATPAALAILCMATAAAVAAGSLREHDRGFRRAFEHQPRNAGCAPSQLVPADVVIWVVAVGVSFGILEGGSAAAVSGSATDLVARTVPCLVVVLLYLVWPSHFDLRWLYVATLPLLLAGLSLAGRAELGDLASAALFCMGASVSRLVSYFVVCSRASRAGASSLFGCSCVMLLNVVARNVGVSLSAVPAFPSLMAVFYTLAVVVTSAVVVYMLLEEVAVVERDLSPATPAEGEAEWTEPVDTLEKLAEARGLSPREADVFLRMMAGETTAQIGDALFISAGAVRSHTSRIYEKFGVHSRPELEEAAPGMLDTQG